MHDTSYLMTSKFNTTRFFCSGAPEVFCAFGGPARFF